MYRKKECVAMLLAGGQGSRLYVLTKNVAKPAVPFGGKYRIIDFPLSNCINSGIDTVGVLTQYEPHVLNAYIGSGQTWDLDRLRGGVSVLPPYQRGKASEWYKGTANAIYQNIPFIADYDPEYVLILSGDHIYKMDYNKMLRQHKETGADATIAVLDVPLSEASRFGIMNCKPDGTIYEFEEKPKEPKSTLASMGIYIFSWKKLRKYLEEDEANSKSSNDFGKDIIPAMLANGEKMVSYRFEGYWKDVGTIESLWEANMDLLSPNSGLQLSDDSWKIYGRTTGSPPHFTSKQAKVTHTLLSEGCEPVLPGLMDFCLYCIYNSVIDHDLYSRNAKTAMIYKMVYQFVLSKQTDIIKMMKKDGHFRPPMAFDEVRRKSHAIIGQGVKMGEGWLLPAEMVELISEGVTNIVCTQPFGCLPNHIAGKGMIRKIREVYPQANIVAVDYDPGASKINQENRIKLMLSSAE